jgi:RNA polymerase sigma-70 factor (ECF subfamily)
METQAAQQEQEWIAQARQGDLGAFAHLVQAYQRPVYNLAYRMLGNVQDAEDAAQETFLRAFQHLQTYDPRRKFATWILSIASHHCVDRLRRQRRPCASLDEAMEQGPPPAPEGDPEETAAAREASDEVQRLLLLLGPRDRLTVVLYYWYGMSHSEIAEATASSVSAVKSRLHRARLALAKAIQEQREAEARRLPGSRSPQEVEGL